MKRLSALFLVLASCGVKDCLPPGNECKIKPGMYTVISSEQQYSCTDGFTHGTNPDTTAQVEIKHEGESWIYHYIGAPFDVPCVVNGTGLTCMQNGQMSLDGLCNFPVRLTVELSPTDTGFVGTSEWFYNPAVCTNGNTGSCTQTAVLEGTLQ